MVKSIQALDLIEERSKHCSDGEGRMNGGGDDGGGDEDDGDDGGNALNNL